MKILSNYLMLWYSVEYFHTYLLILLQYIFLLSNLNYILPYTQFYEFNFCALFLLCVCLYRVYSFRQNARRPGLRLSAGRQQRRSAVSEAFGDVRGTVAVLHLHRRPVQWGAHQPGARTLVSVGRRGDTVGRRLAGRSDETFVISQNS